MPSRLRHFISTCAQFPTAPQVTYRFSRLRFLGTVLPAEFTWAPLGYYRSFFLSLIITVQKVWGEIYEYLIAFFFNREKKRPSLGKDQVWKYHPQWSLLDRLYLRPLAHAVDCDRYDHDIPFCRVMNSKVHRLLTSVCRLDAHGTQSYHGNHPSSHPRAYVRSTAITYQSMYSHGALGNISALCAALSTEPHFNVAS